MELLYLSVLSIAPRKIQENVRSGIDLNLHSVTPMFQAEENKVRWKELQYYESTIEQENLQTLP